MKITIKQRGVPIRKMIDDEIKNSKKFQRRIMTLGKKAHRFMLEFIASHTQTFKDVPQSDAQPLIETIDFEEMYSVSGFGWGIGDIETLKKVSRHYELINYGGKHPQAGKKVPGYFQSAGIFTYAPYSGHFITIGVDTVIEPMDYIQATLNYLDIQLKKTLAKYGRG